MILLKGKEKWGGLHKGERPQRSREEDRESCNIEERKRRVAVLRESALVFDQDTRVRWNGEKQRRWTDEEGWQHEVKNATHKSDSMVCAPGPGCECAVG